MTRRIVKGKRQVVDEARNQLASLISETERAIKGAESEYLFHVTYLFPNLFASLAKKRQIKNIHYTIYDITWLRATNGLTFALNRILPKFVPLELLTVDVKFEKTFSARAIVKTGSISDALLLIARRFSLTSMPCSNRIGVDHSNRHSRLDTNSTRRCLCFWCRHIGVFVL